MGAGQPRRGEPPAKLPAEGGPKASATMCWGSEAAAGYRPKLEAAAGWRSEGWRLWRSRRLSRLGGGGGQTAAAAAGPHKEETAQLVGLQLPPLGLAQRGRGRPH